MTADVPDVSVVVATHNRRPRLERLLNALRAQSHPADRFEVIVVDDASSDGTDALLDGWRQDGALRLRVQSRTRNGGSGVARDEGWRLAIAPVVAFTDDDCEPAPDWIEAGLRACGGDGSRVVQGQTRPICGEIEALPPVRRAFARTIEVTRLDPAFQTCNVFYPRELLERIDGFDTVAFPRWPGEDADLAWRAIEAGGTPVFAPEVQVAHAVNDLGAIGKLRHATRWDMKIYAHRPQLRRASFARWIFWKETHYRLTRAALSLVAAPGGSRPVRIALLPLRLWLAYPYVRSLWGRSKAHTATPLLAPYYFLYDLVEMATVMISALRYRTPML